MLTEHVHLTSGNTLPEVTTRENLRFGKLFMAKTLGVKCGTGRISHVPHSSVLEHSPGGTGPQWNLPSCPFGRCSERLSGWTECAQLSRSRGDFFGAWEI